MGKGVGGKAKGKRMRGRKGDGGNATAGGAAAGGGATDETGDEGRDGDAREDRILDRFLDGTHCFDEICTELAISERELLARLKGKGGDVQIICR